MRRTSSIWCSFSCLSATDSFIHPIPFYFCLTSFSRFFFFQFFSFFFLVLLLSFGHFSLQAHRNNWKSFHLNAHQRHQQEQWGVWLLQQQQQQVLSSCSLATTTTTTTTASAKSHQKATKGWRSSSWPFSPRTSFCGHCTLMDLARNGPRKWNETKTLCSSHRDS